MKRYIVGIDAGVTTGVALYDREEEAFIDFFSSTFWGVYFHEWEGVTTASATYLIERPRKGIVYTSHGKHHPRVMQNIAFKAGENNRESSLLVEGFRNLGYEVETITPSTTKWSAKKLEQVLGITQPTNEHSRDAIKIIWEKYLK